MPPDAASGLIELYEGDSTDVLIELPPESVHCVVTSPPYWGLRDYGLPEQIGRERTLTEFIDQLCDVFQQVWRVLRDDGTLWLNMGDSYSQKSLTGQPWRLALALQERGWRLRSCVIWAKPNPMPESIRDRPTTSHEYVFLLAKRSKYFYDADAVREPNREKWSPKGKNRTVRPGIDVNGGGQGTGNIKWSETGRNLRSVWFIPPKPYPGAHYSVFPPALVEPCVRAGTSEAGVCFRCGAPWKRIVDRTTLERHELDPQDPRYRPSRYDEGKYGEFKGAGSNGQRYVDVQTKGWKPTCACRPTFPVPATVLDPFVGSGTTCLTAESLGRRSIGIDLKLTDALERLQMEPEPPSTRVSGRPRLRRRAIPPPALEQRGRQSVTT